MGANRFVEAIGKVLRLLVFTEVPCPNSTSIMDHARVLMLRSVKVVPTFPLQMPAGVKAVLSIAEDPRLPKVLSSSVTWRQRRIMLNQTMRLDQPLHFFLESCDK
jgi:hypothetical protein